MFKLKIFIMISLAIILSSCASSNKNINLPLIKAEMISFDAGGKYYLLMKAETTQSDTNRAILKFGFVDSNNETKNNTFQENMPEMTYFKSSINSYNAMYYKVFESNSESKKAEITHTSGIKLTGTIKPQNEGRAMELFPKIVRQSNGLYLISLSAVRTREIENEYFPSSQDIRVIVISGKGEQVWISDKDVNFMTKVMPVLPVKTGDEHNYFLEWNGKRNNGSELPSGIYKIVISLTARPNQYVSSVDLYLD